LILGCGCGWAWTVPIYAAQTSYGVGLQLVHDTNIALVPENPQADWTENLIAGLFFQDRTADATARVLAQVEHRHFVNHTFSDDTGGYLDGAVVWTISPKRFNWVVEDTFRDVALSVTAPNSPANLGKSNTFSTGPDLTFALGSTNSASFGGRYGRFDIKDSAADNRRALGYVRATHDLSSQSKISLNYETSRTTFPQGAAPNASRRDYFGRYDSRQGLNFVTLDLGATHLSQDGLPDTSGHIARLGASKALSSQSAFRIGFSDQVSDTFSDLIGGITSSTAPVDPGVVVLTTTPFASADLYRSRRGDLAYLNDNGRLVYTVQVYARNVDFFTLDQDYKEVAGAFVLNWMLSGDLRINGFVNYAKRDYYDLDRRDTDRYAGLGVVYKLSGSLTGTLQGSRLERQSTEPFNGYLDNRLTLILGYSWGPYEVRSRR
jgi:hypothetical protein